MEKLTIKGQANELYAGWSSIDRLYDAYAKSMGLTYAGLEVLEVIYENPDVCTQKFIAEQTHSTKQSVNMIIKSFLEEGWIRMTEIPTDRRNKLVKLTAKGTRNAEKIVGALSDITVRAFSKLTQEQRESFMALLKLYVTNFEDEIKQNSKQ